MKKLLVVLPMFCLLARSASALPPPMPPPTVTLSETSVIDPTARYYALDSGVSFAGSPHCSYGGPDVVTTALGYNFVLFYNQSFQVCLGRRPVGGGAWKIITFTTTYVPPTQNPADCDNHDYPTVGISENDGRIHLAYGHHVDNLRYRISNANAATIGDASFTTALFSAERSQLTVGGETITQVTYPEFITQENSKKLILTWRGDLYYKTYMANYNDDGTWSTKKTLTNGSTGSGTYTSGGTTYLRRRSYPFHLTTKGDTLYLPWTWRQEPGSGATTSDLNFGYSTDNGVTWKKNDNSNATLPMQLNHAGVKVYDIGFEWDLINGGSACVGAGNNILHVLVRHNETGIDGGTQRYWHYWRDGTTWNRFMLPFAASSRPSVFIDRATTVVNGSGQTVPCDTLYVVVTQGAGGPPLKIFAAQRFATTGEVNWTKWTQVYSGGAFSNGPGGPMPFSFSSDGTALWVLGQDPPANQSSTSASLKLLKFAVDSNP